MFSFWNFFLTKARFTILLAIFLVLFGVFSAFTIPKESNPEVRVPVGIVTTVLPGATPIDVEELVTNIIEDEIAGLENVREYTSTSRESVSTIVVEFRAEADLDSSLQDLQDRVDTAKRDLPSLAEEPIVTDVDLSDEPILFVSLSADLPVTEFRDIAKTTESAVLSVPGVSEVAVNGMREREIHVIADTVALELHGINMGDIVSAIQAANTSLPIGGIEMNDVSYAVRLENTIASADEIENIPITNSGGEVIFLRDIAFVSDGAEQAQTLSRISIEGEPSQQAITLIVRKQPGGNIMQIGNAVKERVNELAESDEFSDVSVLYSFDAGDVIRTDLLELVRTGLTTVVLVMIVLFFAVGFREALIAGLAIPLSFLISFTGLSLSGNTINFVSLFSLILAIGILVDSAIVVVEAMHTRINESEEGSAAARDTLTMFQWPLISGTLTTIAVFVPLFFISGVTGKFIASIPFTVIFVLLASIFVALGILPLVSAHTLKKKGSQLTTRQEHIITRLQNWYRAKLETIVGNKKWERGFFAILTILFIVAFALPATGLLRTTFFPQIDIDFVFIDIEAPFGTTLGRTDLSVRAVEEILYDLPEVESFITTVGSASDFSGFVGEGGAGTHLASITINLRKDRERTSTEMLEIIRERTRTIQTADVRVFQPSGGPPVGAPIQAKLFGTDLDELARAADTVERTLAETPGTTEITVSSGAPATELVYTIDRVAASELGIPPAQIAQTLRTAVEGTAATSLRDGSDNIDIVVRAGLNPDWRTPEETNTVNAEALRRLTISGRNGSVILGSIVDVSTERGNEAIQHENGDRIIAVNAELSGERTAGEVAALFEERAEAQEFPEGVSLVVGGETEEVDQAFRDMIRALLVGIFLIAFILVLQFNSFLYPLLIIAVPPISLIGLLLGLTITGKTLSFPSMMGFIALAGIVVNNAIIMIDAANRLRETSSSRKAIIEASVSRLRPILLTTITTVVGLIPLIFVSELWGPLAIAVIFGLSFSLVLTLLLIPILYARTR